MSNIKFDKKNMNFRKNISTHFFCGAQNKYKSHSIYSNFEIGSHSILRQWMQHLSIMHSTIILHGLLQQYKVAVDFHYLGGYKRVRYRLLCTSVFYENILKIVFFSKTTVAKWPILSILEPKSGTLGCFRVILFFRKPPNP